MLTRLAFEGEGGQAQGAACVCVAAAGPRTGRGTALAGTAASSPVHQTGSRVMRSGSRAAQARAGGADDGEERGARRRGAVRAALTSRPHPTNAYYC
jgi:hypothetical protein